MEAPRPAFGVWTDAPCGLYIDRASHRGRDHRDPRRDAVAVLEGREGQGQRHQVRQQPASAIDRDDPVFRRLSGCERARRGTVIMPTSATPAGYAWVRHNNGMNVIFCDYHIEWILSTHPILAGSIPI